jgi:hypothetical protein
MPPTGNSAEVLFGPGTLYAAPIGTTAPASASAALPTAWREIGWTDSGSSIDINYTNEGVMVEEEFYPVVYKTTKVECTASFSMKQVSRENLALALNLGANALNGATILEPWRGDSVGWDERWEATLQSIRRIATMRLSPDSAGSPAPASNSG